MALNQCIEEMPERRERLVLRRRGAFEALHEFTGKAGRDVTRPEPALVAPAEEPANDPAVGTARMFIADAGLEKVIGDGNSAFGVSCKTATATAVMGSAVGTKLFGVLRTISLAILSLSELSGVLPSTLFGMLSPPVHSCSLRTNKTERLRLIPAEIRHGPETYPFQDFG